MHRILFQIGPVKFYTYGLFVGLAIVTASFLVIKRASKSGIPGENVLDCITGIIAGGLAGGRLLFVIINWQFYSGDPLGIFRLTQGGLAFHGALLGALAGGAFVTYLKGLSFTGTADLFAPYIALGQSIGRIGCFFNGCCYGIPASAGVVFPGADTARIPSQLIYSALHLVIFVTLIRFRENRPARGSIFSLYLIMYGLLRFGVDFLRGDNPVVFAGLKLTQIISIPVMIAGVFLLMFFQYKRTVTNGAAGNSRDKRI